MWTRANGFTESRPSRSPFRFSRARRGAALLAGACVLAALLIKLQDQNTGHIHHLPMLAAIMMIALLANRSATFLAIALSVIVDLVTFTKSNALDVAANAALFVVVASVMAEICHRMISRSILLDSILASAPLMTLDGEGRIIRITTAATELLGVARQDVLGLVFSRFVPSFDQTALAVVVEGGPLPLPAIGYWVTHKPNGEILPLTIHAKALSHSMDEERVVLSLGDQRPAETARGRTVDLTDQLHSVWRLNSMGQMAATLAHELNQPLTAAMVYLHAGQSDIARMGPIGDSADRALNLAKTQLLRAGEIIRRTRELISTGDVCFAEERVSAMIDDLMPVFTLTGRDTGVTIRLDIHEADDRVHVDRIQIQQAVANLVRNAVDAVSGRGDGLIRLTGRPLGNQEYEIVVEDNGPGIPEDQMARIFQPMTTTKTGGMGLGLSVTRSIIESHGGVLTVGRSDLGGAAFSFRLSPVSELEAA